MGGGGFRYTPSPVRVIDSTEDTEYDPNVPTVPLVLLINAPKHTMNRGGVIVDSGTTYSYFQLEILVMFKNAWRKILGSDPPKGRDNAHLTDKQRIWRSSDGRSHSIY